MHYQYSSLAFFSYTYFMSYPSICPPCIHLIFLIHLKKVADISKLLPKHFNMLCDIFMYVCYQHLNCDFSMMNGVCFQNGSPRPGLGDRLVQRNRNPRIRSLTVAFTPVLNSLTCCVHTWILRPRLVTKYFFNAILVSHYQCEHYGSL